VTFEEPSPSAPETGTSESLGPVRTLPTMILYPTSSSGTLASGAPYPLIVFSQGFDEPASAYSGLLDAWAKAGFVVAAPTYPFTVASPDSELNEADIVNHPADLRFVIGAVARMAGDPSSPLHRVLDPGLVAVAGQSDGGDVSLAVAANTCCRDPAVKAALILSGAELDSFGGSYFTAGSVPLFVAQGSRDTINPPGCSAQLYDLAPQPKYYLDIVGAEHLPPYVKPGPLRAGVSRATIAFLDAYLKAGPSGLAALRSAARLPPQETLSDSPDAPPGTGDYCPGAP
jgi:predicted dienelactone hydrolase